MKKRISLRFESLRASAIRQLGELQTITEAERLILQEQYDAHSERWQQGEEGKRHRTRSTISKDLRTTFRTCLIRLRT